jgi:hypothetical protein
LRSVVSKLSEAEIAKLGVQAQLSPKQATSAAAQIHFNIFKFVPKLHVINNNKCPYMLKKILI